MQIMQLPSAVTSAINTAPAINIYHYYGIERKHMKETNDFAGFLIHAAIRSALGPFPLPSVALKQSICKQDAVQL